MAPDHRRETTYDVRVWSIRPRKGTTMTTYQVRWAAGGRRHSRSLSTRALADSVRADLLSAARRGEAFDLLSGLPSSMTPAPTTTSWWEWTLAYVDTKWSSLAPGSRRGVAEALVTVTAALTDEPLAVTTARIHREAMTRWAYNVPARREPPPERYAGALAWLARHSRPITDLEDASVTRAVLEAIAVQLDGSPAAASTVARKRAIFHNALELAVERNLLTANPLSRINWRAPKVADELDRRVVVNHDQARRLLAAVEATEPAGPRLVAYFACMYYAAMRPAEVTELRLSNLRLPAAGWGELVLSGSNPDVPAMWNDTGKRQARQLKHRAQGAVRVVPSPPQLTAVLHRHVETFGHAENGRLFRGPYGGIVTESVYGSVWQAARAAALTPAEVASPLASRPYQLRHAAVSTWLAAGVDSTQVAAWAGHSVHVLHRVYAQVIAGRQAVAKARIEALLDDLEDAARRDEPEGTDRPSG
jgi:integrase